MLLVAFLITLHSITNSGGPILLSSAVDMLAQDPSTQMMLLLAGGVLTLGVTAWVINYGRQLISYRVVGAVVLKMREDVFDATVKQSCFSWRPKQQIARCEPFFAIHSGRFSCLLKIILDIYLRDWYNL